MINYFNLWLDNNLTVVILCIIVFGAALTLLLSKNPKWINSAPSIITTIGIACTFFGVSTVLLNMNTISAENMDQLMSGLKTTFIPSTEAILFAVLFKVIDVSHQPDLTNLFYRELQLNNEYLHALMNYHIPGFNLPSPKIKQHNIVVSNEKNKSHEMLAASIQNASLVISKSNQIAIVILFDKLKSDTPIVTVKAKGSNARFILKLAQENKQLMIINDRILASQLYFNSKIGQPLSLEIEQLIMSLIRNS
jgi:type III secretory pathway component EscU